MKTVDTGHIVIEPDVLGGEPHIVGHRIAVSHIAIWILFQGATVEEIAQEFGLTKGEIHAALAYYYDHKEEIDRDVAETDRRAQEMAKRFPHGWSPEKDAARSDE